MSSKHNEPSCIELSGPSSESFTFFGIRKTRDNDTFRAKRRTLLEQLKKDVKRLMEESATRNSLPENSGLVLSFCVDVETCLRFGLRNCSPQFYREPSVVELLQKIAPQCPEAATLVGYLTNSTEKMDKNCTQNKSFLSILGSSKPTQPTMGKTPLNHSYSNPHWIHLALMEKLLQPIVGALFNEGKKLYQHGSIVTTTSDARIFLSLLSGPCALNYTVPTMEDPYWSTLHADELLERHRFISLSTQTFYDRQTHGAQRRKDFMMITPTATGTMATTATGIRSVERTPVGAAGPRAVVGLQQHSSTSSNSSANSGGIDGLYQPRRHQLLYAKNNVTLGNTRSYPGYLAVYCNLTGVNIRWTSNELLLQASSILRSATPSDDPAITDLVPSSRGSGTGEEAIHNEPNSSVIHVETVGSAESGAHSNDRFSQVSEQDKNGSVTEPEVKDSTMETDLQTNGYGCRKLSANCIPAPQPCLNIAMKDIDYIHCHSDNFGIQIVFVDSDGIQHPPIRLPGGWKSSLDLLSSLELGLAPLVQLDPPTESVRELLEAASRPTVATPLTFRGRLKLLSASDASPGPPNAFKRIMHFCSLKSTTAIMDQADGHASGSTEVNDATAKPTESSASCDEKHNVSDVNSDAEAEERLHLQLSSELVFKLIRSEVSPDAFSDKSVDHGLLNAIDVEATAGDANPTESRDMLTDALDAIKCKLMANAFYTWLSYCRYMKMVKTHLTDLMIPGIALYHAKTSPPSRLTAYKWNESFWNLSDEMRREFDPIPIYEHIYHGGCDHHIRIQVWPYLLGIYDWSMTEEQKAARYEHLKQHYYTKLGEWVEQEAIIKRGHPDGAADSLPTSPEGSPAPSGDCSKDARQELAQLHVREEFGRVLESIQKDVIRCDRNHHFFHKVGELGSTNLATLRRVLVTYVWEHLDDGYTQGMCDIIAPLLALLLTTEKDQTEIEFEAYVYFVHLMKIRLGKLYACSTGSGQMDRNFSSLRALVQVMDPELNGHIQMYGDFTHFYFCYRWFLLDFKREFKYEDVFRVWETMIAASHLISDRFELFVALALIQSYRDVIISAQMEFTDMLKFFNERAEKHSVEQILDLARKSASKIQYLLKPN